MKYLSKLTSWLANSNKPSAKSSTRLVVTEERQISLSRGLRIYQQEATPEDYARKNQPHFNFVNEGESLIKQHSWSRRIEEVAALIPGQDVVELGSAEGLLATKLATIKKSVLGVEISQSRVALAQELKVKLTQAGVLKENLNFLHGDIREAVRVLPSYETFVACRVIYHFRRVEDLQELFSAVAACARHVFLLGDRTKAAIFESFDLDFSASPVPFFYYASSTGMEHLLASFGYHVQSGVTSFGDPFTLGRKETQQNQETRLSNDIVV